MIALNIDSGISRFELLDLLSRARTGKTWNSLRLVGLYPEEVAIVKPPLLQFLTDHSQHHQRRGENHRWTTLLVFWLIPSQELESLILEILNLELFNSIYFKCPSTASPLVSPASTLPSNPSLPKSILARAISSPTVEKLTFCNTLLSRENAKILFHGVTRWQSQSTILSSTRQLPEQSSSKRNEPSNNNKENKKPLRTLEFVTCSFGEDAFHHIGNMIRALPNLDNLKLWYCALSYNDQIHLWRCICDHPSLTRLDWMAPPARDVVATAPSTRTSSSSTDIDGSGTQDLLLLLGRPPLEEVLDRVLSSPNCHIRVLGISVGRKSQVGSIFSRLSQNESVHWLDLSYNGKSPTAGTSSTTAIEAQVFGNLHKFRNLQNLDLFCTRLSTTAFRSLISHPVPTLEHISCRGDDLWEGSPTDHVETVLKILETHPNFVEFYGGLHWRTVQVQFMFDIRRVFRQNNVVGGGGSFCRNDGNINNRNSSNKTRQSCSSHSCEGAGDEEDKFVPISLWPIILERSNRLLSSDLRRSRALYWLLHEGPAFSAALPLNNNHHHE